MNIFEFENKKYISINGKNFLLIRGYKTDARKEENQWKFIQVVGTYNLATSDLPEKGWELVRSKRSKTIYTAYSTPSFAYQTKGESPKLIFIGNNFEGACHLCLLWMTRKYNKKIKECSLERLLENVHYSTFVRLPDAGNSKVDALMIETSEYNFVDKLNYIFE